MGNATRIAMSNRDESAAVRAVKNEKCVILYGGHVAREEQARHHGRYRHGCVFAVFMQSPSFLAHQRHLADGHGHGRSNCQTLFGMMAIPSDNHV
jgi:hypothetical protein